MQSRSSPWMAAIRAILVLSLLIAPSLARAQTTIYQYDSTYDIVGSVDANGMVTSMTYDSAGGSQTGLVVDSESNGHTIRYYYGTNEHVVQQDTEPSGVTSSAYDSAGNDVATGDADGHVYQYHYDDSPEAPPIDALGRITSTVYDSQDNQLVIATEDPLGQTTQTYYDSADNVVKSFDPMGNVTATAYDGTNGDLIVAADIGGQPTLTVYDDNGNVIQQIDTTDEAANVVYDSLNNQVIADFPGRSFFDVFTDINVGGVNEFQNNTPLVVPTPDVPTSLAYDSVHNQLNVAVAPETPSLILIAPALLALGIVALRGRKRKLTGIG